MSHAWSVRRWRYARSWQQLLEIGAVIENASRARVGECSGSQGEIVAGSDNAERNNGGPDGGPHVVGRIPNHPRALHAKPRESEAHRGGIRLPGRILHADEGVKKGHQALALEKP